MDLAAEVAARAAARKKRAEEGQAPASPRSQTKQRMAGGPAAASIKTSTANQRYRVNPKASTRDDVVPLEPDTKQKATVALNGLLNSRMQNMFPGAHDTEKKPLKIAPPQQTSPTNPATSTNNRPSAPPASAAKPRPQPIQSQSPLAAKNRQSAAAAAAAAMAGRQQRAAPGSPPLSPTPRVPASPASPSTRRPAPPVRRPPPPTSSHSATAALLNHQKNESSFRGSQSEQGSRIVTSNGSNKTRLSSSPNAASLYHSIQDGDDPYSAEDEQQSTGSGSRRLSRTSSGRRNSNSNNNSIRKRSPQTWQQARAAAAQQKQQSEETAEQKEPLISNTPSSTAQLSSSTSKKTPLSATSDDPVTIVEPTAGATSDAETTVASRKSLRLRGRQAKRNKNNNASDSDASTNASSTRKGFRKGLFGRSSQSQSSAGGESNKKEKRASRKSSATNKEKSTKRAWLGTFRGKPVQGKPDALVVNAGPPGEGGSVSGLSSGRSDMEGSVHNNNARHSMSLDPVLAQIVRGLTRKGRDADDEEDGEITAELANQAWSELQGLQQKAKQSANQVEQLEKDLDASQTTASQLEGLNRNYRKTQKQMLQDLREAQAELSRFQEKESSKNGGLGVQSSASGDTTQDLAEELASTMADLLALREEHEALLAQTNNQENKNSRRPQASLAVDTHAANSHQRPQASLANKTQQQQQSGAQLNLQKDLAQAMASVSRLEEENSMYRKELSKMEALEARMQRVQSERDDYAKQVNSQGTRPGGGGSAAMIQRLQNEKKQSLAREKALKVEVQKLETKNKNQKAIFQTAVEIKDVELQIKQKERDIVAKKLEELQHHIHKHDQAAARALEVESLQARLTKAEEDQKWSAAKTKTLVRQVQQLTEIVEMKKREVQMLENKVAATTPPAAAAANNSSRVTELERRVSELHEQLRDKEQELKEQDTRLETSRAQRDAKVNALQQQIDEHKRSLATRDEQTRRVEGDLNQQILQLQQQLYSKESEMANLLHQHNSNSVHASKTSQAMEQKISHLEGQVARYETHLSTKDRDMEQLEADLTIQIEQLREQLEQKEQERQEFEENHHLVSKTSREMQGKVGALQQELDQHKQSLSRREEQTRSLHQELHGHKTTLEEKEEYIRQLQAELEEIEDELGLEHQQHRHDHGTVERATLRLSTLRKRVDESPTASKAAAASEPTFVVATPVHPENEKMLEMERALQEREERILQLEEELQYQQQQNHADSVRTGTRETIHEEQHDDADSNENESVTELLESLKESDERMLSLKDQLEEAKNRLAMAQSSSHTRDEESTDGDKLQQIEELDMEAEMEALVRLLAEKEEDVHELHTHLEELQREKDYVDEQLKSTTAALRETQMKYEMESKRIPEGGGGEASDERLAELEHELEISSERLAEANSMIEMLEQFIKEDSHVKGNVATNGSTSGGGKDREMERLQSAAATTQQQLARAKHNVEELELEQTHNLAKISQLSALLEKRGKGDSDALVVQKSMEVAQVSAENEQLVQKLRVANAAMQQLQEQLRGEAPDDNAAQLAIQLTETEVKLDGLRAKLLAAEKANRELEQKNERLSGANRHSSNGMADDAATRMQFLEEQNAAYAASLKALRMEIATRHDGTAFE